MRSADTGRIGGWGALAAATVPAEGIVAERPAQSNAASSTDGEDAACVLARSYQAKCAKALLASAMRCTFSRRDMAVPSFL